MIGAVLGGVATKLAGLSVAAKATMGIGVATAAVAGAGVTGVLPLPDSEPAGSRPAVEVQLPAVPTPHADEGLAVAGDAASEGMATANDAIAGEIGNGDEEADAGKPEVTGLDRARQTPAADHIPSQVPGPPANVPGPNTGAASTGIDRAQETPAAQYLPPFVPGPPSGTPAEGGDGTDSGSRSTGIGTAEQTPAAGRLPR